MDLQITTLQPAVFTPVLGTWNTITADARGLTSYYDFGNADVGISTRVPNAGRFSYLGGSNTRDYLSGQEGSWILGRDGDDVLTTYSAPDDSPIRSALYGGDGTDQLTTLFTDAVFTGGTGQDQFRVFNADVVITDFTDNEDSLWVLGSNQVSQIQTDFGLILDNGASQIQLLGVTNYLNQVQSGGTSVFV
ncbi:hypothetical protein cce_4872 [Crocosphaera subtropica ATCC 51142]|uniref:Uncharacterized protein n=1 Tax=Crocosphaera subtropica (strain ATCC 51142 / BH68) TaxID=43989 RepID=B1X258_CROS5|nr:hypothetical protein [Crocosphaera subtropica]ACB54219.1 hypothetical protein cce_4872 [Crocosphaera subtropica ATCC 51142]